MKELTLTNKVQTKDDKEKQSLLANAGEIPEHIAIIMDGNVDGQRKRQYQVAWS